MSFATTLVNQRLPPIDLKMSCLLWTEGKTGAGYGVVWNPIKRRKELAHRASYEFWYGKIPAGLVVDHLCKNRGCFNPAHLEVVTQKENTRRSLNCPTTVNLLKDYCLLGHPFDKGNTKIEKLGGRNSGYCRRCRICKNRRQREYTQRQKGKA